ncbi:MAG: septum formation protein Maf [Betaproteobacteria bacterium RIFCSPLOWO2_02_FULL_62_17]|nr:MAG: septum formation protein Maf [Betaproteobacteria bacterium RIFCSPLOWO2_02_FULL_62_17]
MAKRIYLASRSARRRELLRQIGVGFEMLVLRENSPRGADIDETPHPGETADSYVQRVCLEKARCAWRRVEERKLPRMPVLAADTSVCIGEEILGKPEDARDAMRMLARLSGAEHRVLSAVAIISEGRLESAVNESLVRFCELSKTSIRGYVESGEAMGKAGGYAIQGRAAAFISSLRGSYSGVMGLPLFETAQLLDKF